MAEQTVLRFTVVILMVLMSSGLLTASTLKVDSEKETGPGEVVCFVLKKIFQSSCYNSPPPNGFCNGLGTFLKCFCNDNPACLMATTYSTCMPAAMCEGHQLPYGQCPSPFVCCYSFSDTTSTTTTTTDPLAIW
ncbi:hypothetical protein ACOMHN_026040 [Nucella lapillus]